MANGLNIFVSFAKSLKDEVV